VTRFVRAWPAIIGLVAGVGLNIYLWLCVESVSWLWWNVFGFLLTLAVACGLSLPGLAARKRGPVEGRHEEPKTREDMVRYALLAAATVGIILISWGLGALVSR